MMEETQGTVVVGIGNPILSDDSVGWRVAEHVESALTHGSNGAPAAHPVQVVRVCVGGLALAETLAGYRRAVILDAILTAQCAPGTIHRLRVSDLPGTLNTASTHDMTLVGALRLLRHLGARVPDDDQIRVIGVEVRDVWSFGEQCTEAVERSIPLAVTAVLEALAEIN